MAAELELAAVETALSYLDQFPPETTLAINISASVAITPEFFAVVAPFADRLIIELTEHEPVHDYDTLVDALTPLRELGARIAIDDVGAGFSSLRHILRLAPEIVKLDLSLTRGMASDTTSRALTSAFVEFADRTGVLIAAEGIETEHELDLLRELGVDHGQGYFLGPPLPPAAAQLN
jgi:EAL domain-containing protein (putative c-di-GMP-specific phosphodiesterase class I)